MSGKVIANIGIHASFFKNEHWRAIDNAIILLNKKFRKLIGEDLTVASLAKVFLDAGGKLDSKATYGFRLAPIGENCKVVYFLAHASGEVTHLFF